MRTIYHASSVSEKAPYAPALWFYSFFCWREFITVPCVTAVIQTEKLIRLNEKFNSYLFTGMRANASARSPWRIAVHPLLKFHMRKEWTKWKCFMVFIIPMNITASTFYKIVTVLSAIASTHILEFIFDCVRFGFLLRADSFVHVATMSDVVTGSWPSNLWTMRGMCDESHVRSDRS